MFAIQSKQGKEAIHSGHFMVSHFEAEEQDDEDELAVPIPEITEVKDTLVVVKVEKPLQYAGIRDSHRIRTSQQQLAIDTSLAKLFQCMSLAYRFVYITKINVVRNICNCQIAYDYSGAETFHLLI